MNVLLMNRDGFVTPADGWYQIAPVGEFPHAQAGVTQVVDVEACSAMANRFTEESKAPNFAGLLVDFDHFSLDGEKKSEAAGWITSLENRAGGLYAKIRWSDVGESAVKGGRYRFLSPVWNRADCVDLGGGRVRPVRLLNAAVTNDPNFKGMCPLSNRSPVSGDGDPVSGVRNPDAGIRVPAAEPRFKWALGNTAKGHCPSCAAMAGQVHTMPEWDASGVTPGSGGLFCQGACKCSLEPTDEDSTGAVVPGPMRRLANTGWTDAARAASLAVRQARSQARGNHPRPWARTAKDRAADRAAAGAAGSGKGAADTSDADQLAHEKAADEAEHQDTPPDPAAEAEQLAHEKAADEAEHQDAPPDPAAEADQLAHEKAADEAEHQDTPPPADGKIVTGPDAPVPPDGVTVGKTNDTVAKSDTTPKPVKVGGASAKQAASLDAASADVAAKYEKVGLSGLTPTETNTMLARVVRKVQNGTTLTPTESSFLTEHILKVPVKNRAPVLNMDVVHAQIRDEIRAARLGLVAG